jgi:hypothetical protein
MNGDLFKTFPGGLELAVLPLSWQDKDPGDKAAVRECLQQVARAHRAEFKEEYVEKVDHLLSTGMMKGYAMKGRWTRASRETCLPHTIGVALGSEAIILRKIGKQLLPFLTEYRDDTAILKQSLTTLMRECPEGMHRPRGLHLSQYMEREIASLMQLSPHAPQAIGTLAEVSNDNTLIMRVMDGVNAEISKKPVLELMAPIPSCRWRVDVSTELPTKNDGNHIVLPHSFLKRWPSSDGNGEIGAAFSLCPSSMSKTVPHVHLVSSGDIPEGRLLEDILASLLSAGQEHIKLRQERERYSADSENPGPVIDIHSGRKPAWRSLVRLSGDELFMQLPPRAPLFGDPLSEMRIYCFEDKLYRALSNIEGIKVREYGEHSLSPVFLENEVVTKSQAVRPLRPLGVIEAQTLDKAA